MKALSVSEKFQLIRAHGGVIKNAEPGMFGQERDDVIMAAQRVIELAKSIPKIEWGE